MASADENTTTDKNYESLTKDEQTIPQRTPQDSIHSRFHDIVLYAVQRADKNPSISSWGSRLWSYISTQLLARSFLIAGGCS